MRQAISRFSRQFLWRLLSLRARTQGEDGGALVELALIAPFIIFPLMLAALDLGALSYNSIQISNAAHVAALYGMQGTCCVLQTSQMQTVAQNEAPAFGSNLTVTPTSYYACSASQASPTWTGPLNVIDSTSLATAKSNCTGASGHVLAFVMVTTSAPVPLPFHCCGITGSVTVKGKSVMEVEELP
jgi:Flp pilus assembly protein TadG